MNIAVVHYHLNRGGVAQVVLNHLRSLDMLAASQAPEQVILCYGGRREGWPEGLAGRLRQFKLRLCEIPGLDYDEGIAAEPQPGALADRLRRALGSHGCLPENTLLHVHNHALGKNVSLPGAVGEWAQSGFPLLLEIHDFAEDFRPTNYRRLFTTLFPGRPERVPDLLYPQARHIHYAVLNARDEGVLRRAGIDATRLHLLPNPVPPLDQQLDRSAGRARLAERFGIAARCRYVLYPVRGIRRKNLGEALLWSAVAESGTVFGFTLPPLNPAEKPSYARWRSLAGELHLACIFEVGGDHGLTLAENFAACDRVLTTSVAEGFGLAFLEGSLARRPLIGRDLPEVTTDFVRRGLTFAGLHSRLDVPLEWFGRQEYKAMVARTYNATMDAYGRPPLGPGDFEEDLAGKLRHGRIDFGDLDAALQERILRTVRDDPGRREILRKINPWLRETVTDHDVESFANAEGNAVAIRREYSLEATGRRLSNIYRQLITEPRSDSLRILKHGERIADHLLNLSRFRPVRL